MCHHVSLVRSADQSQVSSVDAVRNLGQARFVPDVKSPGYANINDNNNNNNININNNNNNTLFLKRVPCGQER